MQAIRLKNVWFTDKEKKKIKEELQEVTSFISSLKFVTMRRFKDVINYQVLMINYRKSPSESKAK